MNDEIATPEQLVNDSMETQLANMRLINENKELKDILKRLCDRYGFEDVSLWRKARALVGKS